MDILESIIYGNSLQQWLIAMGVALLVFVLLQFLKLLLSRRLAAYAKTTHTYVDNIIAAIIKHTKTLFILVVALWAGSLFLALPQEVHQIRRVGLIFAGLIQLGVWSNAVINDWINSKVTALSDDKDRTTTLNAFGMIAKTVIWVILGLLMLDNIPGVEVSTLIASLGVVGIAVALAVQGILADLFASLSIMLDKPFVIGDFITVGEYQGEVEDIGLKSTRLRSSTGEELVFSNTDLLASRIRNYRTLQRRRVLFTLGIPYQTSHEVIAQIPELVQAAVEAHPETQFGHTYFKEFGDSALIFEILYHVEAADFSVFKEITQSINIDLYRRFEAAGVQLAYPTQTVYVEK